MRAANRTLCQECSQLLQHTAHIHAIHLGTYPVTQARAKCMDLANAAMQLAVCMCLDNKDNEAPRVPSRENWIQSVGAEIKSSKCLLPCQAT